MIVDSSALLAVIFNEVDEDRFLVTMVDADRLRISAAAWVEAAIVVDRHRNPAATIRFEDLNKALRLEIVPVSVEMAYVARVAHRDYGRGSHPAKLNYGDCFSYALSKHLQEPLLFKGNDFSQTDIVPALKD